MIHPYILFPLRTYLPPTQRGVGGVWDQIEFLRISHGGGVGPEL